LRVAIDAISVKTQPRISDQDGKKRFDESYLPIIGCMSGTRFLKPEVKEKILDEEKKWISNSESGVPYGRHCIIQIHHKGGIVYLKLFPELPGSAYAVESFCRHLFGEGLTTVGELFRFQSMPILLSQGIIGENVQSSRHNFNFVEQLSQVDIPHFTEHFLAALLYHPEDAKPDNLILSKGNNRLGFPCYKIVDIDYDRSWVQPVIIDKNVRENQREFKHVLQLKTMIFCLDHMKTALDRTTMKKFIDIDLDEKLRRWLKDCKEREEAHFRIFKPRERKL